MVTLQGVKKLSLEKLSKGSVIAVATLVVGLCVGSGKLWLNEHDAIKKLETSVSVVESSVTERLNENGDIMRVHMDTVHVYTTQELQRIRMTQDTMRKEQSQMSVDVGKITVAVESMQKSIEKIESRP